MLFSPQESEGHTQQVNHLFLELTSSIQRTHSPDLLSGSHASLSRLFSNLATQNETAEYPRSGYISVTPLNLYLLHSDWKLPPPQGLYLRTRWLFSSQGKSVGSSNLEIQNSKRGKSDVNPKQQNSEATKTFPL